MRLTEKQGIEFEQAEKAQQLLDKGKITLGEFETMVQQEDTNKEITVTLTDKSHKHAEMQIHKIANPELVLLGNAGFDLSWFKVKSNAWNTDVEYFLCHPDHEKECLHCLNGGHVDNVDQEGVAFKIASISLTGWHAKHPFMDPDSELRLMLEPKFVKFEGDANDAYRAMLDGETLYSGDNKCPWYFDDTQFVAELGGTIPETIRYIHGPGQLYRKVEQGE